MSGLLANLKSMRKEAENRASNRGFAFPENVRELTGYEPRPLQAEIEAAMRRFNVLVLHRRFGKSFMEINKLIARAVECPFPAGRYAYLGPTYSQTEDIAWDYLKTFTEKFGKHRKVEEGKLAVTIPTRRGNTARIRLYGVDSPKQRLRGSYLDGCVMDEAALIPWHVYAEQVRPMLSDRDRAGLDDLGNENQWCDFVFTPKGRNHMHTLFLRAERWMRGIPDDDGFLRNNWYAVLMAASQTNHIDPNELKEALADMSQSKYDQEFECSFDAAIEGAIFGHEMNRVRREDRIGVFPHDRRLPVHTAWDLGRDDATAIWFFQVYGIRDIRLVGYLEAAGKKIDLYADDLVEMQKTHGWQYGYHLLPHDVEVTDLSADKSRAGILRQAGVRVTAVPKHGLEDGIEAARVLLPYCRFNEETTIKGIDCLTMYQRKYNEALQNFSQQPLHNWASHGADAFRTLAMGLRRPRQAGDEAPGGLRAGVGIF